jgi:glycosyltransferase involved in cell wall biosynthesis
VGAPFQGRCPASEVNDGGCPENPVHLREPMATSTMNAKLKDLPMATVVIAGEFPAFGTAASTRAMLLAASIRSTGENAWVASMWPTAISQADDSGTDSPHVARIVIRPTARGIGRIGHIMKLLSDEIKARGGDVIIIYGGPINTTLPVYICGRMLGLKVFAEVCEWFPLIPPRSLSIRRISYWKYVIPDMIYRITIPLVSDGVICVSSYIQRIYRSLGKKCLVVPSLTPPVEARQAPRLSSQFRVVYTGIFKPEDCSILIVRAVRRCLLLGHKDIFLEMIGNGVDLEQCKQLAEVDSALKANVMFTPFLFGSDYFNRIASASCLVLIRPYNKINEANFPTRLPEYLATGNPVIISSVGDIEQYATHGMNAHIIDSVSEETLSQAIITLSRDPKYCEKLGLNGQKLAATTFSVGYNGKKIVSFIHS